MVSVWSVKSGQGTADTPKTDKPPPPPSRETAQLREGKGQVALDENEGLCCSIEQVRDVRF